MAHVPTPLVNGLAGQPGLAAALSPPVSVLAESEGVRECLQFFTREKRWINERHLELCRIPALTFQEQERAACLARVLAEMGYEAQIDRSGNVVASVVYERGAPFIALTAHMDTVLAPRSEAGPSRNQRLGLTGRCSQAPLRQQSRSLRLIPGSCARVMSKRCATMRPLYGP